MADFYFNVRRFSVGDWDVCLWTHIGVFTSDFADTLKAAAEGVAFHVEESFEKADHANEGYAESCGRLAQMILDGVKGVYRVEVAVDGDGVVVGTDVEDE